MTPVGKIVKLLLALVLGGAVAAGLTGCKEEAKQAPAAPPAQAKAPEAPQAPADDSKPREVELKVTAAGYEPSPVSLKKGQPVVLKVTRTVADSETCATEFVLDEYGINEKLPVNQTVTIRFTPDKTGELKYGCGMGKMVSGRFRVE